MKIHFSTINREKTFTLSLDKLPAYLIYQILDHLEVKTLFYSTYNVCQHLNNVINSYDRYKVKFN